MNLTPNSSTPTLKILVIGAGFGGIASALRLRSHGYQVTLVDRLSAIGGRAQVFERSGFRHDAGPTVITAPFLFDELFALYGEDRKNYPVPGKEGEYFTARLEPFQKFPCGNNCHWLHSHSDIGQIIKFHAPSPLTPIQKATN